MLVADVSGRVVHRRVMVVHVDGLIAQDVARRFVTLGALSAGPERHREKLEREQPQQKPAPTATTVTHAEKIAPPGADHQLAVVASLRCPRCSWSLACPVPLAMSQRFGGKAAAQATASALPDGRARRRQGCPAAPGGTGELADCVCTTFHAPPIQRNR